eukprot:scaffold307260_cov32-Tisochrysis_lutea.AAC.3
MLENSAERKDPAGSAKQLQLARGDEADGVFVRKRVSVGVGECTERSGDRAVGSCCLDRPGGERGERNAVCE